MVRLERLRALGEMSAGISHNLNNMLTGILGPAQMIQTATDDPEVLADVDTILTSAQRAGDLSKRLYRAARGESDHTEPVPVNEVVAQVVRTATPKWKDTPEARGISIDVITNLEDVPPILGTKSGLHDILTNLLFNAVDALPDGGTVVIGSEPVEKRIRLTVTDTGIGMDTETRKRAFDPFFTTKMDTGTGLGLATVYGTVSQWGGTVEVESTPGVGTTFTIHLPAWKAALAETPVAED